MQEPQKLKDFFISYTKADRVWAEWIAWELEEAGYTTILQAWDFRAGMNFILEIDRATQITSRTLALLSPDYLNSVYTQPEWAAAFGKDPTGKKRILIPIRVRVCEPEGLLKFIGYIDLVGRNELDAQKTLLAHVQQNRAKPDEKPRYPGEHHSVAEKPQFPPVQDDIPRQDTIGTTLYTYDIHSSWISAVAWSPDGTRIASGGGDKLVRMWNASNGQNYLTYQGHWKPFFAHIWDVKWSSDGKYIASCGFGTTVRVWNATTGEDIILYNEHGSIDPLLETLAVAWSPDGTRIVSASSMGTVKHTIDVWDARTGRVYLKYAGHKKRLRDLVYTITALAWSPDGAYIASSGSDKIPHELHMNTSKGDKTLQVWNATTGEHIMTCKSAFSWVNSLAWSPDTRYIASAESEKVVRIWDATNGKQILQYQGHTQSVRAIAWSPDGSCIASASNDRTVHLWNPCTGDLLYVYRGHRDKVTALAWSPDGKHIASASSDKTVKVWKAMRV